MFGGTPTLKRDLSPPPKDVQSVLKNDIAEEQVDLTGYMKLASLAESQGLVDHKMEEQATDEHGHAAEMRRLLG